MHSEQHRQSQIPFHPASENPATTGSPAVTRLIRPFGSPTNLLAEPGPQGYIVNAGPETSIPSGAERPTDDTQTIQVVRKPVSTTEAALGILPAANPIVVFEASHSDTHDEQTASAATTDESLPQKKKKGRLKDYALSFGEHGFWYGLSYASGMGYLKAAEHMTSSESTQNLAIAGGTYALMIASLGVIGERVIRKLITEGYGGNIFAKFGLEHTKNSIKRDLMTNREGKPALDEEGAEAVLEQVREQFKQKVGDKKSLKERDDSLTVMMDEALMDDTQKYEQQIVKGTKRAYIAGQVIEELPWYAVAYMQGITNPRELLFFMAGTAVPTILSKVIMYRQYRKYSGTEPIMFPESRKKLKKIGSKRPYPEEEIAASFDNIAE